MRIDMAEALRVKREEAWKAMLRTPAGSYERRIARAKWQTAKRRHDDFHYGSL